LLMCRMLVALFGNKKYRTRLQHTEDYIHGGYHKDQFLSFENLKRNTVSILLGS
jgi:hypothetical protein